MTIEAQLDKLIEINQALLTHFQSLGAVSTQVSAAASEEDKPARTRRTKKQIEEDAAAESAAAEAAAKVEADAKGEPAKEEAKNEAVATATIAQETASTEPSATAQQATASASSDVEWKAVIEAFTKLMQAPGHGRNAVVEVIKVFNPAAEKVPALESLNLNGAIVAHIEGLLNPAAEAEEDPMAALGL